MFRSHEIWLPSRQMIANFKEDIVQQNPVGDDISKTVRTPPHQQRISTRAPLGLIEINEAFDM